MQDVIRDAKAVFMACSTSGYSLWTMSDRNTYRQSSTAFFRLTSQPDGKQFLTHRKVAECMASRPGGPGLVCSLQEVAFDGMWHEQIIASF